MWRTPIISLAFFALSLVSYTYAHEGEINSCGGHVNDKTNEYHIHNYKKYRACTKREKATEQAEKKMIFKCGNKSTCEEMANCKEAKIYFEKCRLSELDKNKDGIPCEQLCK